MIGSIIADAGYKFDQWSFWGIVAANAIMMTYLSHNKRNLPIY